MKINRNNYESYFLDYLEGNLDSFQVTDLLSFLEKNPDLESELSGFENIKLSPHSQFFQGKESIKKNYSDVEIINESNFEEFCIANLEGDLLPKDEVNLENYLNKNPQRKKDFEFYSKTILKPDKTVLYSRKSSLKKFYLSKRKRRILFAAVPAAASVIIFISVVLFQSIRSNPNDNLITQDANQNTENQEKAIVSSQNNTQQSAEIEIIQTETPENVTENTNPEYESDEVVVPVINENISLIAENLQNNEGQTIQTEIVNSELINTAEIIREDNIEKLNRIKAENITPENIHAGLINIPQQDPFQQSRFLALKQSAITRFKSDILKEEEDKINKNKLSFWDIADAGVRGINKLTGAEMKINKQYDEEGNITALAFDSKRLQIERTIDEK